jgi:hypothetical protein
MRWIGGPFPFWMPKSWLDPVRDLCIVTIDVCACVANIRWGASPGGFNKGWFLERRGKTDHV